MKKAIAQIRTKHLKKTDGTMRMLDLTPEQLVQMWHVQNGRCALSGIYMTHTHRKCDLVFSKFKNASLDRIDSAGDYTYANMQLVCSMLNHCKNSYSNEQFITICKLVTQHQQ